MKNFDENMLSYYRVTKSYGVREKQQTDCAPGSQKYEKTKHNRLILKCTCASCGAAKTKFVNQGN